MSYLRVMPRDLFNEANLLKCLGRLGLLIVDEKSPAGLHLTHPRTGEGFDVTMDSSDGSISVESVALWTDRRRGHRYSLRRGLNARGEWPLYVVDHVEDDEIPVFDDDGDLSSEFVEWANSEHKEK